MPPFQRKARPAPCGMNSLFARIIHKKRPSEKGAARIFRKSLHFPGQADAGGGRRTAGCRPYERAQTRGGGAGAHCAPLRAGLVTGASSVRSTRGEQCSPLRAGLNSKRHETSLIP